MRLNFARPPVHTGRTQQGSRMDDAPSSRISLALIAIICGIMGFVLAMAAVPAQSTALAADGLIFLRESALAWIAMWVTFGAFRRTGWIARLIGLVMVLLGAGVLVIALARLNAGSFPEPRSMILFGALAFVAQILAAGLALRSRREPFSGAALWRAARDGCMAHLLVIAAGAAVMVTGSNVADIVLGAAIAGMFVLNGIVMLTNGRMTGPFDG
jgi:Co/Zn/Cd efflux system component